MSMNPESSPKDPSAIQQRRQANMLLIRLQWLTILLLIAALLWLYISQQRFEQSVHERLQSNEQVISRLNEMDDRLFAMSQQTLPEPRVAASSQAQNQLDLLRIQIKAVDRLLMDNNDSAAIDLLRGLHWQLSQSSNEIAPALTVVIKQSLLKDIERLQAQSSQPSPWQMHNLAVQNIQTFLQHHERYDHKEGSKVNKNPAEDTAKNKEALTRRQLAIHETIMTLNLAMQASNMRDREQLISYLSQARKQLTTLTPSADERQQQTANPQASDQTANITMMQAPNDVAEVINWLDQLIVEAPRPTALLTTQVLAKPQR
ncbi:hypothetical protein R0I52_01725 [Psychrobacter sp. CAM01]|uniref:hypothetical protein n=1 Tax=Psychrobacter sp. CAM01 TaxID=3080335 RepID=UPI002935E372|nr:hypothetical protein [Psychrobacter sp. CAM01]MDV2859427.1 hypothetical protein [Psychrobacter sp. CAM01]